MAPIKRGIPFIIDFILILLLYWGYCALFAHRVGPRHYPSRSKRLEFYPFLSGPLNLLPVKSGRQPFP